MVNKYFVFISNILIFKIIMAQTDITTYLEKKIIGRETPGFQYIIADTCGIIHEYYGGYANIESKTPITSETEFKMYSATKTFTALAIMQLIDSGKLSLDDDAGLILDLSFPRPITVRQLLSHTAGVTSTPLITEIHPSIDHEQFDIEENAKRLMDKYQDLKFTPGKKKKYSNFGYLLLGEVIEKISKKSYTSYVTEYIFERIGNNYSYGFKFTDKTAKAYQKTHSVMHVLYGLIGNTKTYYDKKVNGFMGYKDLYLNAYSYGGAFTNAKSLVHYGQMLLKDNSILLSNELKELLFTEQKLNNGKPSGHTLGWFIKNKGGIKYYSHPGGGGGFSCEIRIYPEYGIVSVFMMNTTQLFSHLKLLDKLDRYFLPQTK